MTTPIRAVAYYRKSTEDRDEDEREQEDVGESIKQQREWVHGMAPRENLVLVAEFPDQSLSGLKRDRPGLRKLIAFCQEQDRLGNPIDVLVVWHSNRLSRQDQVDTFADIKQIRAAGVGRMLASDGWRDLHNPDHLLVYSVNQYGNHKHSRDLSAATLRGKLAAARKGLWAGGPAPFGYAVEGRKLVVDPAEADAVRLIFESYADESCADRGLGLRGVADLLRERGIKTPTGKDGWAPQTLYDLLQNPVYLGHIVCNRRSDSPFLASVTVRADRRKTNRPNPEAEWVRVEGTHPALVTPELFERVQKRLAANKNRTTPKRGHPFLLVGMLRCGHCGGPMIGRTHTGTDPRSKQVPPPKYVVRYYVCHRYNAKGKSVSGCNNNPVREDRLVRAVARKLAAAYFNPATLAALRDEVRRQEGAGAVPTPERALVARIEDLDRKIKTGNERFLSVPDNLIADCRATLDKWAAERDRLRAELAAARARQVAAEDLDDRVERLMARAARFQDALEAGEPAIARETLREMIDRVELFFSHRTARKRVVTTFARGLIYLNPESLLGDPQLSGTGTSLGQPCNPIEITAEDLADDRSGSNF